MMDALAYTLHHINDFKALIRDCNNILLQYRKPGMKIEWKEDARGRKSPVTDADITVNDKICKFIEEINVRLAKNGFKYIIVAEENEPEASKSRFDDDVDGVWYVDGLDGTSDFIDLENESATYTCGNIGLAVRERDHEGNLTGFRPVFGIFSNTPAEVIYWGHKYAGSYLVTPTGVESRVLLPSLSHKIDFGEPKTYRVAISGKHCNKATTDFLKTNFKHGYKCFSSGSSVKVAMVSSGLVDIYPRLGPTMEWDICAAHAFHRFAGGRIVEYNPQLVSTPEKMRDLEYNKPDLYNPFFLVF